MMYASNVLRNTREFDSPAWGNFAASVVIPSDDERVLSGAVNGVRSAMQSWSKVASFPRDERNVSLWQVTHKDIASSVTAESEGSATAVSELLSFLLIGDKVRQENQGVLLAAGKLGMTSLILTSELLTHLSERPESYALKTGEITLDYMVDEARISCVFNEAYSHIMYVIGNEMHDEYFERPKYTVTAVRQYIENLISRIKGNTL